MVARQELRKNAFTIKDAIFYLGAEFGFPSDRGTLYPNVIRALGVIKSAVENPEGRSVSSVAAAVEGSGLDLHLSRGALSPRDRFGLLVSAYLVDPEYWNLLIEKQVVMRSK